MSLSAGLTQCLRDKRLKMKNKIAGIYEIKNINTGKVYIGQSKDITHVWQEKTRAFKKYEWFGESSCKKS